MTMYVWTIHLLLDQLPYLWTDDDVPVDQLWHFCKLIMVYLWTIHVPMDQLCHTCRLLMMYMWTIHVLVDQLCHTCGLVTMYPWTTHAVPVDRTLT